MLLPGRSPGWFPRTFLLGDPPVPDDSNEIGDEQIGDLNDDAVVKVVS